MWRKIPLEHRDATSDAIRLVNRTDHLWVPVHRYRDLSAHGLARHRQHVRMDQVLLMQFQHHRHHPTGMEQVLDMVLASGSQVAEIRGTLAHLVRHGDIEVDLGFMGDSRQVQHAVGAAAQGHVHRQGIFECFGGHDV